MVIKKSEEGCVLSQAFKYWFLGTAWKYETETHFSKLAQNYLKMFMDHSGIQTWLIIAYLNILWLLIKLQ